MAQGDKNWFRQRSGMLTGSRFSALMAVTKSGPSTSRANLITAVALERITGTCEQTYQNAAMLRGIELEPKAREAYEIEFFTVVDQVDFIVHPDLQFVGVSPDGLVGTSGMVELKCPTAMHKHLAALRNQAQSEYRWQLQGQLWVAGREWNDFVSYHPDFPEKLQIARTRVMRDEKAIAKLEAACIEADEEINALVKELQEMAA